MGIGYAREQASKIVHRLGSSSLPLRERLLAAYLYAFLPALGDSDRDYLPEELNQSMRLLDSRMRVREDLGSEGVLQSTLTQMTDRQMEECADAMIDIAVRILRVERRGPG